MMTGVTVIPHMAYMSSELQATFHVIAKAGVQIDDPVRQENGLKCLLFLLPLACMG